MEPRASVRREQSKQDAKSDGFVKFIAIQTVKNAKGELIAMNRNSIIAIIDDKGREKERYQVVYGAKILFEDGARIKTNDVLLEWDPYTFSILTEVTGVVHFKDLTEGVTMQEQVDEITGRSQWVVMDSTPTKSACRLFTSGPPAAPSMRRSGISCPCTLTLP